MCGIAGFVDPKGRLGDPSRALTAMHERLAHRGPDGFGIWFDASSRVGLAHRRLAIVELSPLGAQPMVSASGRFRIIFNGEVYNFPALRAELEALGERFRGRSDTEVMLAAIERWGLDDAVRRFAGMFAFALWDSQTRTLSLVRDRLGKKPLYFGWIGGVGGVFAFASELKAMRVLPGFDDSVDPAALQAFLRLHCVPGTQSIHPGIAKVAPGTITGLCFGDEPRVSPDVAHREYWSLEATLRRGAAQRFQGTPSEALDALEPLLRGATSERLVADVPLGAFLSGGIDSSLVVALMQELSSRPVRTFTIGFREEAYDEARHAKAVAEHVGTDHTELVVTPEDALAVVPRLGEIWDEPFADASQIPTFLVSQLTRREVTVALSGDGGDELFGGYNRHRLAARVAKALAFPRLLRRAAARCFDGPSVETWDALARVLPGAPPTLGEKLHKLASLLECGDLRAAHGRLVGAGMSSAGLLRREVEPTGAHGPAAWIETLPDPAERMMAMDLSTYLIDDILVKVDRASMAVALETRAPLLDHRVVEFAATLPAALRIRNGESKWPLRALLARRMPESLFRRPKQGFGVPIARWLGGALRPWADELLSEANLRRDGLLAVEPLRRLWHEYLAGRTTRWPVLWGALMYLAWRRGVVTSAGRS